MKVLYISWYSCIQVQDTYLTRGDSPSFRFAHRGRQKSAILGSVWRNLSRFPPSPHPQPGFVHRKSREHQLPSQPRHREHADQKGLPADRPAGPRRPGGEHELQAALAAVETLRVSQQEGQQEECGENVSKTVSPFCDLLFL